MTLAERCAAMTWAQRLKRVFGIDNDQSAGLPIGAACGGAVRIIAFQRQSVRRSERRTQVPT
jgi:hypothetical protein